MSDTLTTFIVALAGSPLVVLIARRLLASAQPPTAADMAARILALETRVEKVEDELEAERREKRAMSDYIEKLRAHIAAQQPPPAPPWPDVLT